MHSINSNSIADNIVSNTEILKQQDEALPQLQNNNTTTLLESSKIDINDDISANPTCISIQKDGSEYKLGTSGNFSAVIGKAKSKKSFLVTMVIAAAIAIKKSLFDLINISFLPGKDKVLFFDTEQSKYHVYRALKRICTLAGTSEPTTLGVYGLRKFKPAERLEMIEYAIYNTEGVGLVVIDGLRDLVSSINDEEQATDITSRLLRWTEERNIHIIIVIHQNKGDNNARGHIGTEIINKAETVISVTKETRNKNISTVKPEYCRDREFDEFSFEIDEKGLPNIIEDWAGDNSVDFTSNPLRKPSKKPTPYDLPKETHTKILLQVFEHEKQLQLKDLELNIISAFQSMGTDLGRNKAGEYRQYYMHQKMIEKVKVPNKAFSVYQLL